MIVAETINSRFLNVISLFNGVIPLVAIQMQAFRLNDQVSLVFTTVLSELKLGPVDEDEEVQEVTDRSYWEKHGSKASLEITDSLLTMLRQLDPGLSLKYNKFHISLAKNGHPTGFVIFRPKKKWVRLDPRLDRSEEIEAKLEEAGLDVMEYDTKTGRYRIRLTDQDIHKHESLITELFRRAYDESSR